MTQKDKTKEELIGQIKLLQKRIAELGTADTGRRQQQQQMKRLAIVVRDSNDAITLKDFDGRITAWNRGAELMYGYSEKEALRMNVRRLIPPDKETEHTEFIRRLMAGETVPPFETRRVTRDGRILDIWLTVTKVLDDTGKPIGIATTERDITARKRSEEDMRKVRNDLQAKNEELKRLNQIKSDFISTVSHELRTPLSITKEGISLILDRVVGDINERQSDILATSRNNIDRLARIINELLDISKIEAGRLELKMEPVNITAIIKEVTAGFEPKIKERGLELKADLPAGDIEIYADPDKMVQIFTNLINNAVRFTDKGFIEVSVKETPGAVACSVSDTGVGISREDLPNVFEKFQQFGRVAGPGDRGTGLGLSIVRGLVEAHKGNIRVESSPGEGTKFTFNLPKYNTESLLREYVNSGIEAAKKSGFRMSLISVSMANFAEVERKTTTEDTHLVLKEVRNVIAKVLRREGDTVIRYTGEIMALLPNCGREGVLSAQKRIESALNEYLKSKRHNLSIKLNFGCVTYPDDAETGEGLVVKARKLALYNRKV